MVSLIFFGKRKMVSPICEELNNINILSQQKLNLNSGVITRYTFTVKPGARW